VEIEKSNQRAVGEKAFASSDLRNQAKNEVEG
jgi:hypothetical protein